MTSLPQSQAATADLEEIEEALARLAPRGFTLGLHIRYSRPVRRVSTYPSQWIQTYTQRNLGVGDPMMIWCVMNQGSIAWHELIRQMPDPLDVMGQARAHGLVYGAALAWGPAESRSYIGAAHPDRDFTATEIARMAALLRKAHDLLDRDTALRPILVAALEAIACGMTYDQACEALGISRTALRYRLRMAREVLGAEDNPQAVRKAIDAGLLNGVSLSGLSKGLPTGPADSRD
ncbi:LuxR family transcriptional regulator [Paracoccus liaowanqingii]|uniref:LuxR family transcriptional regulator n=1 Tax=Paracoccus liaowanqingii TaxID=2560053 RepID=A0A4P7HI22_9RHOB|nr:autoinducer binding domain-containing protein [Paracoccus liaowanqingii]QBX33706.1 LuxR family transcriptional regulator [Paracoccus liaowanqingii]